ncbi:PREDICTED: eukaryotic translation initiation factor 5B partial [Prunus dulcis]|uniref:PREDICTED: eukaryotic translation initiation factor 5B partial n=1 Tax=Prunus dulcis TaxID=3755 RepID=A0A5E4FVN8_PRUDU|nr:PREDICTED: eukaryotic translation initiation factor 5B partial [Prunus dulcis]
MNNSPTSIVQPGPSSRDVEARFKPNASKHRRVLMSGDWESPPDKPVRFHTPTKKNIQKVKRMRTKVLAAVRVYPDLLLTPNLVKAKLVGEEEKLSNRQLIVGNKARQVEHQQKCSGSAKKKKAVEPSESEMENQTLGESLIYLDGENRKAEELPKKPLVSDHLKAIFAVEDNDDQPANLVNIACPPKSVKFVNHMIVGLQMDLAEIEELLKWSIWEEAGRAFHLQASAFMDMWLYMKRAIMAAKGAKKMY